MNPKKPLPINAGNGHGVTRKTPSAPGDAKEEISAVIDTLIVTERRLKELTAREGDTVAGRVGRAFLGRRALDQWRLRGAASPDAILNALPAHIALLDARGVIVSVNEAWRQFAGTPVVQRPGYAIGLNYLEICAEAPGDNASEAHQVAAGIRAVLAGQKNSFSLEYGCHSPAGQRWFELTVTSRNYDRSTGAVVMHLDVTASKQADRALRESNEKFQQLAGNITDVFWINSPDLQKIHYVSPAYEQIWGRSVESLYADAHEWGEAIVPSDRERVHAIFSRLAADEPSASAEFRIARPDGTVRWILNRGFQVRDAAGKVIRITGVASDITERKQAETALREREAEFRALAEAMPQMVWMTRPDGWNIYFSQQWMDYTGLTLEESLGHGWNKPFHPEDKRGAWEAWQRATATAGIYSIESRLRRADGIYRWWLVRGVPLLDATGRILKWFGTCTDIHDLKLAELEVSRANRALQQQQSELRALFDLMPAMILFRDTENRILRVNNRVGESLGKPVEAIEGKLSSEIYPQDAARYYADDLEVIRSGVPRLGVVEALRDAEGRDLWMQTDKVPVRDKDGKIIGVVIMAQDITARTHAEAARVASEERFRSYFELGLIGMVIFSANKSLIEFNYEICQILGYGREELSQKTWAELTHPDDLAEELAKFDRICAGKMDGYSLEKRLLRKDGRVVHAMIAVKCVRRTDGTVDYLVGLLQDITERKQADLTLRESEKRFKALFEQAAVGVAQIDAATGGFVQVNQRFCEIVGRSGKELELLTFAAITHPEDVDHSLELTRRVKAGTMREFTEEKRYLRKDRTEVWASVTVSAMWSPGETPDSFIAIVQDVTGRKHLEEQFRQAQKMEAIGTLAGGIAHDFNNVLAAINGYTELAKMESGGNATVLEYLDAVLHGARRATDLVRQILAFSRQQELERKPIQLRSVVGEALELLRATIPATIGFEVSLEAVVPNVLADASQVHQIMMNLCTNAAHAMKDRTGRLTVKLEKFDVDDALAIAQPGLRSGPHVRLSVGDTGCGMDEATMSRIFDPFFTTKGPGEGTGLGLAVVHGIMHSHEGAVTVHSRVGEGTTFHLYFPTHAGGDIEVAAQATTAPFGLGERILYVDDEETLTTMGRKILERLGYVVDTRNNAVDALAAVRQHPDAYDLVVTDQTMPGMTGTSLAEKILAIRPDLPIILTTGYSALLTAERVQAMGIRKLLLKPLTFDAFGSAVRSVLIESKPT